MSLRELATDASCAPDGGAASSSSSAAAPVLNPLGALARAALDAPPGLEDSTQRRRAQHAPADAGQRALLLLDAPPAHLQAQAQAQAQPRDMVDEFFAAHPAAMRDMARRHPAAVAPPPPHALPPYFPHVVGAPYARIPPPSPAAATAMFESAFAAGAGRAAARAAYGSTNGAATNGALSRHVHRPMASQGFRAPGWHLPLANRAMTPPYADSASSLAAADAVKQEQRATADNVGSAAVQAPVSEEFERRARERAREQFPDADGAHVDAQIDDLMHTLEQLRAHPVVPDEDVEAATRDWQREFQSEAFREEPSSSREARPRSSSARDDTRVRQFANSLAQLDGSAEWADEAQLQPGLDVASYTSDLDEVARSTSWSHEFTGLDGAAEASLIADAVPATSRRRLGDVDSPDGISADPADRELEHAFSDTFQADLFDFLGRDPGAVEYEFMADNQFQSLSARQAMQEGLRLRNEGQLALAAQAFESAISSNKLESRESARGWFMLGSTHAECDDDQRAIQAFLRCIESCRGARGIESNAIAMQERSDDTTLADALLALGVSYTNELNVPKALMHLNEWLETRKQVAGSSSDAGAYSEAWDASSTRQRGYGLDNGTFAIDEQSQEEHARLVQRMERITQDCPDDVDVRIALGILYNLSREYDLAAEALRMAVTLRPDDARLWNKLGATLANGNESDDALRAYRKAVDLAPNFIRAWVNVGTAYANRSSFDKAARYYLKALSMYAAREQQDRRREDSDGHGNAPFLGNSDMVHVWGYLRTTLVALQREDLLPLIDGGNVDAFRPYIAF